MPVPPNREHFEEVNLLGDRSKRRLHPHSYPRHALYDRGVDSHNDESVEFTTSVRNTNVPIINNTLIPLFITKSLAYLNLISWGQNGKNHLIFTFSSSGHTAFLSSEAIVASVEFPVSLYQPGFNIPLILPNPLLSDNPKLSIKNDDNISNRQQTKIDSEIVKRRKNQDQWFR